MPGRGRMWRLAVSALAGLALAAACAAAPASAAPRGFYGVVAQGNFNETDFELMQRAGVETLRFQFTWPQVQPTEGPCEPSSDSGTCDWSEYDELIGSAAARGVRAFPYFLNVPDWISQEREEPPVRSDEARQAWSDFVTAAVERYGPGGAYWETDFAVEHPLAEPLPITAWQIWNEPSAAPFWHPRPKPREYGKLVKLTSPIISAADPRAYIVLAGLFGTPVEEDGGINQDEFLRALYRTPRIERFFDAVAIHPYGPDLDRVKVQVDWARDEMKRAGDREADLWISEIGWASDRVHNQLGVGRKGQAKMLRKMFRMFERKRSRWNVKGVNWYAWQDTDGDGYCDFCRRSGLIDVQQQPKPSYEAFREQARE
jgi:Glycosyl hydrolase catalytic core